MHGVIIRLSDLPMSAADNQRICATCGKPYAEVSEVWPQFPQCSLCYPTPPELVDRRSPENVFRHYLQVAHGITVTTHVAKEILDAAKSV